MKTLLTFLLLISCNNSQRLNEAFVIKSNGNYFIKLKEKRQRMVHDPFSSNGTYEDSIMIKLPRYCNCEIKGEEIPPTKPTDLGLKGKLVIGGKKLFIDLYVDDASRSEIRPLSWNGTYNLHLVAND